MLSTYLSGVVTGVIIGVVTGVITGVATGVALDHFRERRNLNKRRSKDIFEPLHAQLAATRNQILACQPADAANLAFWHQLNESALINEIPARLHRPLRDYFSETVPNYTAESDSAVERQADKRANSFKRWSYNKWVFAKSLG
jgi:hypothetical protein